MWRWRRDDDLDRPAGSEASRRVDRLWSGAGPYAMLNWAYLPYTFPLILSGIVALALSFYAARHRKLAGAQAFMWLCLAAAEWAFTYALEIDSPELPAKVFWSKLEYLGITAGPLCWLAFALYYTRRGRFLTPRVWALLSIIPLVTVGLVFTNEAHGLIW